jgi:hypothetical protein
VRSVVHTHASPSVPSLALPHRRVLSSRHLLCAALRDNMILTRCLARQTVALGCVAVCVMFRRAGCVGLDLSIFTASRLAVCSFFGRTQKGHYNRSKVLRAPGAWRPHRACSHPRRGGSPTLSPSPARRRLRHHASPTLQHANVSLLLLDFRPKSARIGRFPPSASPLLMLRGRPQRRAQRRARPTRDVSL